MQIWPRANSIMSSRIRVEVIRQNARQILFMYVLFKCSHFSYYVEVGACGNNSSFLRNFSTSIQGGSGIVAEMPKILRRE